MQLDFQLGRCFIANACFPQNHGLCKPDACEEFIVESSCHAIDHSFGNGLIGFVPTIKMVIWGMVYDTVFYPQESKGSNSIQIHYVGFPTGDLYLKKDHFCSFFLLSCQVRVARLYQRLLLLLLGLLLLLLILLLVLLASSRSQWASPDLNSQLPIAVATGPERQDRMPE